MVRCQGHTKKIQGFMGPVDRIFRYGRKVPAARRATSEGLGIYFVLGNPMYPARPRLAAEQGYLV